MCYNFNYNGQRALYRNHKIKQERINTMRKKSYNFDLVNGEKMEVAQRCVIVYGKEEIRFYNLEGKLLRKIENDDPKKYLSFYGNTIKNEDEKVLFFNNCFAIKEDKCWTLIDYQEKKILGKFKGDIKTLGDIIVFGKKLYDTTTKKWVYGEAVLVYKGFAVMTSYSDKYVIYNYDTKMYELYFDSYFITDYCSNFFKVYANNKCGLIRTDKKTNQYLYIPIEYQKIKICGSNIFAYKSDGCVDTYDYNELRIEAKEKKFESEQGVKAYAKVFGNIIVSEGEVLYLNTNYIIIEKEVNKVNEYVFYSADGTFIGKSASEVYEYDYNDRKRICIPNCYIAKEWIALCESNLYPGDNNGGIWNIYTSAGKKVFEEVVERIGFINENCFVFKKGDVKLACWNKGQLEYCLEGKFDWIQSLDYGEYLMALDLHKKGSYWICDSTGKLVLDRKFGYWDEIIGDVIITKGDKGADIYDFLTGKCYSSECKIKEIHSGSKLVCFDDGNKKAIYKITTERSENDKFLGFKEITPFQYEEISAFLKSYNTVCGENSKLIYAEAEDWEDIYDFDGNLIATTKV